MNVYQNLGGILEGMSDEKKEGILLGIELMGNQGENWLDNEEQALHFRNDLKAECGFSGWMETYEHTAGFIFAENPEKDGESQGSSEKKLTDDCCDGQEQKKAKRRFLNEYIASVMSGEGEDADDEADPEDYDEEDDDDDEDYEEDDDDEEDDEDDEEYWEEFTYDGIKYLVGPDKDTKYAVIDPKTFNRVGVLSSMHSVEKEITFEDHDAYEKHMMDLRETNVPTDGKAAVKFLLKLIKTHYPGIKRSPNPGHGAVLQSSSQAQFVSEDGGYLFSISHCDHKGDRVLITTPSWPAPEQYNTLGQKVGDVMKEIEMSY